MILNDRDLLESRLQIETVRHAEDRVSSMYFAMPSVGHVPTLNVSSSRYSTTKLSAIYLISSHVTRRAS